MPYKISSVPLTKDHAARGITFQRETAAEARELVEGLRGNGERVAIRDPDGQIIDRLELEALAGDNDQDM